MAPCNGDCAGSQGEGREQKRHILCPDEEYESLSLTPVHGFCKLHLQTSTVEHN